MTRRIPVEFLPSFPLINEAQFRAMNGRISKTSSAELKHKLDLEKFPGGVISVAELDAKLQRRALRRARGQ